MAASSSPTWLAPPCSVCRGEGEPHVGATSSLFFLTSSPAATSPTPWSRYLLLHPSPQRTTFYIAPSLNPTPPFLHRPARLLASSLPAPAQVSLLLLLPVVPPLSLALQSNSIPSMPQCISWHPSPCAAISEFRGA